MKPMTSVAVGLAALATASVGHAADFGYKSQKPPAASGWTAFGDTSTRTTPGGSAYRPPATYPRASDAFHPYRGEHVYSPRGGVDAYPHAPKPKGYIGPF